MNIPPIAASASHSGAQSTNPATPDQRSLIQAVKTALKTAELFDQNSEFRFLRDSGTKEVIVKIVDRVTGESQQIPAVQVLRMAEEVKEG
jgi:uncharacterized FlaG/YvyC family protein